MQWLKLISGWKKCQILPSTDAYLICNKDNFTILYKNLKKELEKWQLKNPNYTAHSGQVAIS